MLAAEIWQHAEYGELLGVNNIAIRYAVLRQPQSSSAIALCTGRIESYLKYEELIGELYQRGFTLYLWDHRGQGLSGRMLADPQIGHVEHFDHYVADLKLLYQSLIAPALHQHCYLLAHSMGGAIATAYLQQYPADFAKAVLSAPMFGIPLPALIKPQMVKLLARCWPHHYAPGKGPYRNLPFAGNDLTQDPARYQRFRALYQAKPELQLGGPSLHWVAQALQTCQQLKQTPLSTPTLILQAEADTVVENAAQHRFCQTQPNCTLQVIPQARHELLFETDALRQSAIEALLAWLQPDDTTHNGELTTTN